jgi:hypothetical protein
MGGQHAPKSNNFSLELADEGHVGVLYEMNSLLSEKMT